MDFNIDTDLLINESFSDDDEFILKKTEKKQFDSNEVLKLKVEAEEISQENQITELVSYKNVQKKS